MAQAAVSDVAGHWPATAGQWLLAGRSEKTMAGGSSSYEITTLSHNMQAIIASTTNHSIRIIPKLLYLGHLQSEEERLAVVQCVKLHCEHDDSSLELLFACIL